MVAARQRQEDAVAQTILEGRAMEEHMREALKRLQQERARRTVGTQARPPHGHALVQVGASKKVHSVGTSYDLIAPAAPAADADSPPVTHSAEIQTETAYMEREGGTGAPDPTTALAVPSVSSGSLQPYRARVQDFNRF